MMTHSSESSNHGFNIQRVILEDLQMRQAETLIQSGIFRKGLMHVIERSGNVEVEAPLLSGLPLILESSIDEHSYLYLGLRFLDDNDGEIKTKIVQLGVKMRGEDQYIPVGVSRFTEEDCVLAAELLHEIIELKETILPDYNPEIGFLSQV